MTNNREQMMDQTTRLNFLIDYLLKENPQANVHTKVHTIEEKIALFRGLCNIRPPEPASKQFLQIQDDFLTEWNNERASVSLGQLETVKERLYVWQGDITRLAVGAIVNAANSDMLGCMQANHNCIDNIIHTRAGIQLRLVCHDMMQEQKRKEPVGKAKITQAYNLPANYVIHTVGPYIDERGVTPLKKQLLASSYRACLSLADEHGLQSIAFCCISTGVFNFPQQQAAEIAIDTVKQYIKQHNSSLHIIFNVFEDEDLQIYDALLKGNK